MREMRVPILIVGGGVGGVAAALAVARQGGRCLLAEPTDWLGGQLTSQGVPPDENPWIEGLDGVRSATASYLDFRERVRGWMRASGGLTSSAMGEARLNPGGGWVSHLCHEPRVGEWVLRGMLAEHVASGAVDVRAGWLPCAAERDGGVGVGGGRVRSVSFVERDGGRFEGWALPGASAEVVVTAEVVLDATETGELYPLLGVSHRLGAESGDCFGELHARPDGAVMADQQAVSWCFAVSHEPGVDHVGAEPADYGKWTSFVPEIVDPLGDAHVHGPWTGPLFSWRVPGHGAGGVLDLPMVPWPDEPEPGTLEMWRYRRLVDAGKHVDGRVDVSLINCVQMDYFGSPLVVGLGEATDGNVFTSSVTDGSAWAASRSQSEAFLHWMRTDAPTHAGFEHDGVSRERGYRGLVLSGEALGTADGFAKVPYVREGRRPVCLATLTEAEVGAEQRLAAGHVALAAPSAVLKTPTPGGATFEDAVAIGHYRLDLHPSAAGRGGMYAACCPYQVPLGALLPAQTGNLIAAGKSLGVTHLTNAATRLHPVEWAVGEAAGTLAALSLRAGVEPAAFWGDAARTQALREALMAGGAALSWPWDGGG